MITLSQSTEFMNSMNEQGFECCFKNISSEEENVGMIIKREKEVLK